MSASEVRIGTRGSALALAQARLVSEALDEAGHPSRFVVIETDGDRRQPDTAWGEGAFVAAIEQALLDDRVDVAVHSAKDVPTDEDPRLEIAAYLERADPRDVLVVGAGDDGASLVTLPAGARVGTDSPRRTGFLLAHRPELRPHPLHGNVDTRLRRLDEGQTDALVVAAAGLDRLGRRDRISERLDPETMPPAPGQGAVAIQVRSDDTRMLAIAGSVDHEATHQAVAAERAFLTASGGGCRAPIGALAVIADGILTLFGGYAAPDGSSTACGRVEGPASDPVGLGHDLAAKLGTRELLAAADRTSATPAAASAGRRVLVTRAAGQGDTLIAALRDLGLDPIHVPTIAIEPIAAGGPLDTAARRLDRYDWVVVTSANGARAILAAAERVHTPLGAPRWAAIGDATRRILEDAGIEVDLQPAAASGSALAEALPVDAGGRVLLVRGDLADDDLPSIVRSRGAGVDEVTAYRTSGAPTSSLAALRAAFQAGRLDAVVLTSGSTVRGLIALASVSDIEVTSIPAVCIGPETAAAARDAGFEVVGEAPSRDAAALAATTVAALDRPVVAIP